MPSPPLEAIRIILVEPAGPLNIGSVARVMKNMGLSHLMLVDPRCDHLGAEARQMAVHAADVLEKARVVATVPDGLNGCRRAIAATGRPWTPTVVLEDPRQALPWLLENAFEPDSMALIFGPEDRGLNNEELSYAHRFVYIPSNPDYPSLNLAQAVGICSYELHQYVMSQDVENKQHKAESRGQEAVDCPQSSAPLNELEGFYQQFEALLLEVGYLYPHTSSSRMKKFRRLFNRAMPASDEVAMLRGVLSQVTWALKQAK